MRRHTLLLVLLLTLALAACAGFDVESGTADGQGSDGEQTDGPATDDGPDRADAPVADGTGDGATHLALPEAREIHDGVQDLQPRAIERARADETDGSLHVIYWTGVEPCTVLGDIEVDVTQDAVTVTLHEGHLPDENGEPPVCIEIAEEVSARVPLETPLDGRTLIDGATGDTVPVDVIRASDAAAS